MTEGPRQQVFRSSCNGVSVRLRVNAGDESWIVIKAPGTEPRYREIPETKVDAVVAEFQAIGDSTERFAAFVNAYSTQ
jgi:hypothetical protein